MKIACDIETMQDEGRAALMSGDVSTLARLGVETLVVRHAGVKSGFTDCAYKRAGAIVTSREDAWRRADLVIKAKQPLPEDFAYFRNGLTVACFFHLASNPPLLNSLLENKMTAIAYETIQLPDGSTPILAEMSKIAGRIAFFDGAKLLMKHRGVMIGPKSTVVILGLGNAGAAAAELVVSANPKMLYLFDKDPLKFNPLEKRFYERLSPYDLWFVEYNHENPRHHQRLASILERTDLVIGATHIPGEKQIKLVPEWMVEKMQRGSVIMDISIDQGGCFETSRETSLRKPIYQRHGVIHYCVPNMPGMVPRESTTALCKKTFPYILELAEKGFKRAVLENPALAKGVNTYKGWITHEGLARSIGRMTDYKPLKEVF